MKQLSALGLFILLICSLWGCIGETTVVQEAISPDKKYVAIAQIYDGGATTDFTSQVYICHYPNYEKWWYSKSSDEMVFSGYHQNEIAVEWASEKELVIYCKCRADYIVENYWGIKITHKMAK